MSQSLEGVDPRLVEGFMKLSQVCGIGHTSGMRTLAEQQWEWDHRDSNPYPVAVPGTSNHEKGLAIDISGSPDQMACAHREGPKFGVVFPYSDDPIHMQWGGTTADGDVPEATFQNPDGSPLEKAAPANPIPGVLAAAIAAIKGDRPTGLPEAGTVESAGATLGKQAAIAPAPGVPGTAGGDTGHGDVGAGFFPAFLERIGAPVTPENIRFLEAWKRAEGGSDDNPFNTTMNAPGATVFNSVGVKRYPDIATGVDATVRTILEDHPGYAGILDALRVGSDARAAANALAGSAWGTGGLVQKILG